MYIFVWVWRRPFLLGMAARPRLLRRIARSASGSQRLASTAETRVLWYCLSPLILARLGPLLGPEKSRGETRGGLQGTREAQADLRIMGLGPLRLLRIRAEAQGI